MENKGKNLAEIFFFLNKNIKIIYKKNQEFINFFLKKKKLLKTLKKKKQFKI